MFRTKLLLMMRCVLIMLVVSWLVAAQSADSPIRVTGSVVDERDKPLEGAVVSLFYEPCKTCADQIYPGTKTSKTGSFLLTPMTDSKTMVLFIDDKEPEGFWSPLFYLLQEERLKTKMLRGIPLSIVGKNLSLGKVQMPYRYGKLIINLPGNANLADGYIPSVDLVIKDEMGEVLDQGLIPEAVFEGDFSKLKIVLPVQGNGTIWKFALGIQLADGPRQFFDYEVKLRKLECKELSTYKASPRELDVIRKKAR